MRSASTGATSIPPRLLVANSIFFHNGTDGTEHADADGRGDDDDDGAFDENAFCVTRRSPTASTSIRGCRTRQPHRAQPGAGCDEPGRDRWCNAAAGFDVSATYVGAFQPGGTDWTAGWTSYPED